jgi:hypothetical protein
MQYINIYKLIVQSNCLVSQNFASGKFCGSLLELAFHLIRLSL